MCCADYYMRYSGPAGMTEQDDMENWLYATAASSGTIARRYPYNYQQGLGAEIDNDEWEGFRVPGIVSDLTQGSRASTIRAISTGVGPSSWKPRAGTS